jgi:hypothetical protein
MIKVKFLDLEEQNMELHNLQNFEKFAKTRYGADGKDVVQQACLLAMERYGSLDNVNQSLFGLLVKESFRKINSHTKFENNASELDVDVEELTSSKPDYLNVETEIDMQRYANQIKCKNREKRIKKMYQAKLTPVLPIFLSA